MTGKRIKGQGSLGPISPLRGGGRILRLQRSEAGIQPTVIRSCEHSLKAKLLRRFGEGGEGVF